MNARIKAVGKVDYEALPLTTQAGRTALFIGITAGTVTQAEIEKAVLLDNEKRPYRKPVVAYGKRFNSITEAANATFFGKPATVSQHKSAQAYIRRLCNEDKTVGFYWSE